MDDLRSMFKRVFTPSSGCKKCKTKIFVGNGRVTEAHSDLTIDITELAKYTEYFTTVETQDGEVHYECSLTVLPFKKGVNRYGNTHYIIIKNK